MEKNNKILDLIKELPSSKEDIEGIFVTTLIESVMMAPVILIIWKNNKEKFIEFRMRISREFQQDLMGVLKDTTPYDLILEYPENNKEVNLDHLINLCRLEGSEYGTTWGEELNKKLLPYIRNEKLNKLIN